MLLQLNRFQNAPQESMSISADTSSNKRRWKLHLATHPTEVLEIISNYLQLQDFPAKSSMKFTCKRFYGVVNAAYSNAEIIILERLPYCMEKSLYACTSCNRLRPEGRFSDAMRRKNRGKYGDRPSKRFCITCGLRPSPINYVSRYARGTYVEVSGAGNVRCAHCDEFRPARSKLSKVCIPCALV
jgi:hypothetical protein